MSGDKAFSDKDIDNIWRGIKSVSPDYAIRMIKNRGVARPITVGNGYFALLSLDIHNGERKEYHLSISHPLGITNFEIAAAMPVGVIRLEGPTESTMTREILVDCDQLNVGFRGVYHFIKSADESADEEGIHKISKNKEAKLKYGKETVEGDINNGIERRVKKKIQIEGIVERSNRFR